ncbi:MAG: hypothetical protein WAQ98_20685 [Blastocatellia bacterium]
MARQGYGFRGSFASGGSNAPKNLIPFERTLNASGQCSITITNADLYDYVAEVQEDTGYQSGTHRMDEENTTAIKIEADIQASAEGKRVAGIYWRK